MTPTSWSDGQATRPSGGHSIIDLTLTDPTIASQMDDWSILGPDYDTGSDHKVIEWKWKPDGEGVDSEEPEGWKIRGWALKEALEKEKKERKEGKEVDTLGEKWSRISGAGASRGGEGIFRVVRRREHI